jgi:hypothetical protein
MAYELFRREGVRVGSPTLSITPAGRIVVNAAGCRVLKEAALKRVMLLWDRDGRKMALKGAPKGEKHTFTVSFVRSGSSGTLSAKTFLRYIGWNAPGRVTLPAIWNQPDKMFEVVVPTRYLH